ncbi:putative regulator of Ras-like GTPase activity (Roadblock/LC7/MglB family) [Kitasatospora sp. MAP12-15]|uniref:roadblock/LC7 domain-containing protein n=1 Tax=unclassified Kitasatospora TaxID=2633591 RepID=UPI002476F155|nr:roadblock/LC7 domain-containing protein [Kitasatospora sp. MAP12-44]MDH6114917.1 putative regulator of Ras-like GTPase activity (Roadblock/LC7/MglB family) [Kitasatospora sp. MAP12-44]
MTSTPTPDLDWLLNDFAARVPEITHAVAVSADGLLIAATRDVATERGDQLAAIASGLVSLLAGAGRLLEAEPVISNLTELQGGFLFSMAVSSGASLLVLASKTCDIGQVSYEMAELINQVGPALAPAARAMLLNSHAPDQP